MFLGACIMGRAVSEQAIAGMVFRLSAVPDIRLPGQLTRNGPASREAVQSYLRSLLERDPGVFLERYGDSLEQEELGEFEGLRDDYEVDFHLKVLESGRDPRTRQTAAKNRRLACMHKCGMEWGGLGAAGAGRASGPGAGAAAWRCVHERLLPTSPPPPIPPTPTKTKKKNEAPCSTRVTRRLMAEGTYFSETAMEQRQPWLFHHMVGQYRPAPSAERPAAELSSREYAERLLAREDAARLAEARMEQQDAYDAVEEESDSDDDGGDRGVADLKPAGSEQGRGAPTPPDPADAPLDEDPGTRWVTGWDGPCSRKGRPAAAPLLLALTWLALLARSPVHFGATFWSPAENGSFWRPCSSDSWPATTQASTTPRSIGMRSWTTTGRTSGPGTRRSDISSPDAPASRQAR